MCIWTAFMPHLFSTALVNLFRSPIVVLSIMIATPSRRGLLPLRTRVLPFLSVYLTSFSCIALPVFAFTIALSES